MVSEPFEPEWTVDDVAKSSLAPRDAGTNAELGAALDNIVYHSLSFLTPILALLFGLYALAYSLIYPPPVGMWVAQANAGIVLFCLLVSLLLRREWLPRSRIHALAALVATAIMVTSWLQVVWQQNAQASVNLLLVILAVGFVFVSTHWLLLLDLIVLTGWYLLVRRVPDPAWLSLHFSLGIALALSTIVHMVRLRTLRRAVLLGLQNARQRQDLTQAYAQVRQQLRQQQKTEEALRKSEIIYRSLFEKTQAVKLLIDPETGALVDANPAACDFYGYTRDDLLQMHITDINTLPPEQVREEMVRAKAEERAYFLFLHRLASGEVRNVEVYSSPITMAERTLLFSIVHDISDRVQAEAQVRYQAVVLQNVSDAVISTDLHYVVQSWNRAAREIYGWREEEVIGRSLPRLLRTAYIGMTPEMVEAQFLQDGFWQGEIVQQRKDGQRVHIQALLRYVWDDAGIPVAIVATNRDISIQKRTERLLQTRLKMQLFIARLSTEFINCPTNEIDAKIQEALAETCRFADVDQAAIHLLVEDTDDTFALAYEWSSPDLSKPQSMSQLQCLRLKMHLSRTGHIYLPSVNSLPAHAVAERKTILESGAKSAIAFSLTATGDFLGYFTLVSYSHENAWDHDLFDLFRLIADILTSALARKSSDEALHESNMRFRQLVETTRVVPFEARFGTSQFTYVGPQAVDLLGYPQAEWYQPDFWVSHLHSADRHKAVSYYQQAADEKLHYELEYRMIAADGRVVWIHHVVSVEKERGQGLSHGFLVDISQRRRIEASYQMLLEQSLQGLVVYQGRRFVFVNPAAAKIIGYSVEEMLALSPPEIDNLVPTSQQPLYERIRHQLARTSQPSHHELQAVRKDGTLVWLHIFPNVIEYQDQPAVQVVVIDVSERKRTEEALRQAQKLESLGVLAGGIAHDFNNLLVAMMGQTALARARLPEGSPAFPHIQKAVTAAERAADLTRQLLAYSGQGKFQVVPVNLNTLIQENLHLLAVAVPRGVEMCPRFAESLPMILADKGQMQQVVMNLIINAAEAIGDEPGRVEVATGVQTIGANQVEVWQFTGEPLAAGRYVCLRVSDNGCGMERETISRIFDPFFTTKFAGRGLGLAAVLGIVRGHHGGLQVESKPGKGTIFSLFFPPIEQEAVAPPYREKSVLVIDADVSVRQAISDILALEDWRVLEAESGDAGIAHYRDNWQDIALVFLDQALPGSHSISAAMRDINPALTLVLCSTYGQRQAMRAFAGVAIDGYLQKPFRARQLLEIVNRFG